MIALFSLLVVVFVSLLITRIATIALMHTGLSRAAARFQARSAFTGAGFTTGESERVVNHPVRRRIVMMLMLLGNAGIVTVASSLILTFVDVGDRSPAWLKIALLLAGLALLWVVSRSRWFDRLIYRLVSWALKRFTHLDVQDYAGLLHLAGEYQVVELQVEDNDWLAGYTLGQLGLRDEGVMVLAVERPNGEFLGVPTADTEVQPGDVLVAYGRVSAIARLDERRRGAQGQREHWEAVAEQRQVEAVEREHERSSRSGAEDKTE